MKLKIMQNAKRENNMTEPTILRCEETGSVFGTG